MQTVTVITAAPLSKEQLKVVTALVESRIGKATIKQEVDAAVLGGVRLKIGTQEFDASIAGRLEKLERVSDLPVVTTAVPLSKTQRAHIAETLEQKYGSGELSEVVDPTVLGGVKIIVGSEEFDGTIKGKLERIKQRMLQTL
jgi:F-type H+-transporting ATPase subunit delta